MADEKISELAPLGAPDVADILPIVDVSLLQTKSVTVAGVRGLSIVAPEDVGAAGAVGSASTTSPSDHVHAHGVQSDETMHAPATDDLLHGFMTGTQSGQLTRLVANAKSPTICVSEDDFCDLRLPGWRVIRHANAFIEQYPSIAALGLLPGSGVLWLGVGTGANDEAQVTQDGNGHILNAVVPIINEWRFLPLDMNLAIFADDEFDYLIGLRKVGIADVAPDALIMLYASFAGATRVHRFSMWAGGAETHGVDVTMPALGGGMAYRIRIQALTTSATLEAAVDDGAYAVIGTLAFAPAAEVYVPFAITMRGADGAGDRALMLDYTRTTSAREAVDAGTLDSLPNRSCDPLETRVRGVAANDTLSNEADEVLEMNTGGTDKTIQLPDPAGRRTFRVVKVNAGAGKITLLRYGGAGNIQGVAANWDLTGSSASALGKWQFYSNGTDWYMG